MACLPLYFATLLFSVYFAGIEASRSFYHPRNTNWKSGNQDSTFAILECLNSTDSAPSVVHVSNGQCYPVGERGPCDYGEKIFRQEGSLYGVCSCGCFKSVVLNTTELQFCNDTSMMEYVHHPELQKCFRIYDQGPCSYGEWLVRTENYISCERKQVKRSFIRKRDANAQIFIPGVTTFIMNMECPRGSHWSDYLGRCVKDYGSSGRIWA